MSKTTGIVFLSFERVFGTKHFTFDSLLLFFVRVVLAVFSLIITFKIKIINPFFEFVKIEF